MTGPDCRVRAAVKNSALRGVWLLKRIDEGTVITELSRNAQRRRSFGAGALALLAALALGSPALAAPPGEVGEATLIGGFLPVQAQTVAVFELGAPSVNEFTLRGTVPVPKGTFPRSDGKIPFAVKDFDGTLVPAQVERVSSYPRYADGADVVEVLARVHRDPNTFLRDEEGLLNGPGNQPDVDWRDVQYPTAESPAPLLVRDGKRVVPRLWAEEIESMGAK